MSEEKPGPLDHEPFSFRKLKDGSVFIQFGGRWVTTLSGRAAETFLRRVESAKGEGERQLAMAKATKNFKRGNERIAGQTRKRRREED